LAIEDTELIKIEYPL